MSITRREVLRGGAAGLGLIGLGAAIPLTYQRVRRDYGVPFFPPEAVSPTERPNELAYLSSVSDPKSKWGAGELFTFINAVNPFHLDTIGKSLEIEEFNERNVSAKIEAIHREILWQSSNIFTYNFKSVEEIDYHKLVVWSAGKIGISKDEAIFTSTFDLEHRIMQEQFISTWDKLTTEQRTELLTKIDAGSLLKNSAVIALMAGAAALTALSATIYFTGFAFYTAMSVVIATVAGWLGLTLPFAAYMTASSTVAVLSGPIGWAIGAVFLTGALATWAGRANVRKTTCTIMQLHCLKAGALYGAGAM